MEVGTGHGLGTRTRSGMSGVSLPVTRPSGRALLIGTAATRLGVVESLGRMGYSLAEADDPYAGMLAFCRRSLDFQAVILSLASLYREELPIIQTIKRRFPHVEVWLSHTDGRPGALAEAMRLGAEGLLDDDGLHRIAVGQPDFAQSTPVSGYLADPAPLRIAPSPVAHETDMDLDDPQGSSGEPILSADELKALLQEQPAAPQAGEDIVG